MEQTDHLLRGGVARHFVEEATALLGEGADALVHPLVAVDFDGLAVGIDAADVAVGDGGVGVVGGGARGGDVVAL